VRIWGWFPVQFSHVKVSNWFSLLELGWKIESRTRSTSENRPTLVHAYQRMRKISFMLGVWRCATCKTIVCKMKTTMLLMIFKRKKMWVGLLTEHWQKEKKWECWCWMCCSVSNSQILYWKKSWNIDLQFTVVFNQVLFFLSWFSWRNSLWETLLVWHLGPQVQNWYIRQTWFNSMVCSLKVWTLH
jgi:hypothetical protein